MGFITNCSCSIVMVGTLVLFLTLIKTIITSLLITALLVSVSRSQNGAGSVCPTDRLHDQTGNLLIADDKKSIMMIGGRYNDDNNKRDDESFMI